MDHVAATSSFPSLAHFENFIKENPNAENIVVSDGHIVENSSAGDQDQAKTKEALKQALQAKYPEQEDLVNLVDQAWGELKTSGKSWDAHTIRQVIDQAEGNATWKDVGDEGTTQEDIDNVAKAFDEYAQKIVEGLSPEERASLQQQFAAAGLVAAGVGMTALATHVPTHAANAALANLLTTISASLPSGVTTLPMMGAAAPGHLAAASAMMGAGATAAITSASVQVTVASAASAIVPFIIAGAIAHRLYVATSRIVRASSSLEHEVNNITTAMVAAALTAIPPAQHALLLSAIVGGIVGQHILDPGIMRQAVHNIRDAALGVYLVKHPDIAVALVHGVESLLLSGAKAVMSAVEFGVASTTPTTATTTAFTTATGTAATTTTAGTVTQAAPTAALHHSIAATAAHGLSTATTVVAATIAAHPGVTAAILVGGACMTAYRYAKSNPPPVVQN